MTPSDERKARIEAITEQAVRSFRGSEDFDENIEAVKRVVRLVLLQFADANPLQPRAYTNEEILERTEQAERDRDSLPHVKLKPSDDEAMYILLQIKNSVAIASWNTNPELRQWAKAPGGQWKVAEDSCSLGQCWIDGVVEYAGCGSHEAEWQPGALEFTLLAANRITDLTAALRESVKTIDGMPCHCGLSMFCERCTSLADIAKLLEGK